MTKQLDVSKLRAQTTRIAVLHIVLAGLFAASTILHDFSRLVPPDKIVDRWVTTSLVLMAGAAVWAVARAKIDSAGLYKGLIYGLITADLLVAGFSVYDQRGMASRAVALFFIPIMVSAVLRTKKAIFGTAAAAAAVYSYAAIQYFADNPSEGYKAELYGEVGFYSAVFFVGAALIWALFIGSKKPPQAKS